MKIIINEKFLRPYGSSSLERIEVDEANTVYDSRENCNAIIHTSTNELGSAELISSHRQRVADVIPHSD